MTEPLTNDLLGPVFSKVLRICSFVFFSGKNIEFRTLEEEFAFKPTIWSTLNISYEGIIGGDNSMDYPIVDKNSDVWYNIMDGKFYNSANMHHMQ